MTFIQRRISVDATSRRLYNAALTTMQRYDVSAMLYNIMCPLGKLFEYWSEFGCRILRKRERPNQTADLEWPVRIWSNVQFYYGWFAFPRYILSCLIYKPILQIVVLSSKERRQNLKITRFYTPNFFIISILKFEQVHFTTC